MNKRIPEYHSYTHTHTHTHIHTLKNKHATTNLTTGYTLCDVNTEVTIRHNIARMTSTSRVHLPYPIGTTITRCHLKTQITQA